jgi:hypothetical protein
MQVEEILGKAESLLVLPHSMMSEGEVMVDYDSIEGGIYVRLFFSTDGLLYRGQAWPWSEEAARASYEDLEDLFRPGEPLGQQNGIVGRLRRLLP